MSRKMEFCFDMFCWSIFLSLFWSVCFDFKVVALTCTSCTDSSHTPMTGRSILAHDDIPSGRTEVDLFQHISTQQMSFKMICGVSPYKPDEFYHLFSYQHFIDDTRTNVYSFNRYVIICHSYACLLYLFIYRKTKLHAWKMMFPFQSFSMGDVPVPHSFFDWCVYQHFSPQITSFLRDSKKFPLN